MFTLIDQLPDHVIGVEITGMVTADDYRKNLIPMVEEKLRTHKRLDFLCVFKEEWQGIQPGAMWQDLRMGMHNIGHWGRVAIVTDRDWLENAVNIFKILWPGHMRHFELDEFDKARAWVCETERATIGCEIDANNSVLVLEPNQDQSLTEDDFLHVTKMVDTYLEDHDSLHGILIKSRNFPGWNSMGAMLSHFKFVRNHHRNIDRIAIATNSPLGKFADYAVAHFVKAKIRNFDFDKQSEAMTWLRS